MNNKEIKCVIDSWQRINVQTEKACYHFFNCLFKKEPSLEPLFDTNSQAKQRQYTNMLNLIVNGLEQINNLEESLQALGQTHKKYGATQSHYDAMRDSLIETINHSCDEKLSEEEENAWGKAFDLFSKMMN